MTYRILLAFVLASLLTALEAGAVTPQQTQQVYCVSCHQALGVERLSGPAQDFPGDIHAARGLTCVSCHGGDASDDGLGGMDPARGFLGKPTASDVLPFCGRCHSDPEYMRRYNPSPRVDQATEYATSVHGQRLLTLEDEKVATCVSCHPAHNIKPPTDPLSSVYPLNVAQTCGACHADERYMAEYGIATNQFERYSRSVHWEKLSVEGDLSAPTCNDCHGNHGAAPPGISWIGNACGQCHVGAAELFSRSLHAQVFPLMGVPGCAACHNNHDILPTSDTLLGLGEGALCVRCHSAGVGGGVGAELMRVLIDSLRLSIDTAEVLLHRAERAGMEVSHALFTLDGAHSALVAARATIHGFNTDSVAAVVDEGLLIADEARANGESALHELRIRRAGLGVSVTLILGLITALVLKIRRASRET